MCEEAVTPCKDVDKQLDVNVTACLTGGNGKKITDFFVNFFSLSQPLRSALTGLGAYFCTAVSAARVSIHWFTLLLCSPSVTGEAGRLLPNSLLTTS